MSVQINKRESYFDNVKFILIFCVVLGHSIEPLIDKEPLLKAVYLAIYSFHMPAFILISGHFYTRSIYRSFKDRFLKIFKQLIVPYVIFDTLLYVFYVTELGQQLDLNFFIPVWVMWFLFSLILWQFFTPLIIKLRHPIFVITVLALLAGYTYHVGYLMSFSRTLVFFPFFLLGFYAQRDWFNRIKHYLVKIFGVLFIVLIPLAAHLFHLDNPGWFYGSYAYSTLVTVHSWTWLYRAVVYLISFLSVIGILALIPQSKLPFTKMGAHSMTVYLTHGFIVKFMIFKSSLLFRATGIRELLILAGFALAVTLILSSSTLNKLISYFKAFLSVKIYHRGQIEM